MNIPKLFEGAIARVLTTHAIANLPRIRTWQQIDADLKWTPTSDRVLPLIDIRASPPILGGDGVTLRSVLTILVATSANDDISHSEISKWYEAVQGILDSLYSEFRNSTVGPYRTTFEGYIAGADPTAYALISVGGFEHGDPLTPYEDSGASFIGMNFTIHYSRSDY